MKIGWTQNVAILEADLSMEQQVLYLKAAAQFAWSKAELTVKIVSNAHETIALAIREEVCYSMGQEEVKSTGGSDIPCRENKIRNLINKVVCRVRPKKDGRRRWFIMSCSIFTEERIPFMRC